MFFRNTSRLQFLFTLTALVLNRNTQNQLFRLLQVAVQKRHSIQPEKDANWQRSLTILTVTFPRDCLSSIIYKTHSILKTYQNCKLRFIFEIEPKNIQIVKTSAFQSNFRNWPERIRLTDLWFFRKSRLKSLLPLDFFQWRFFCFREFRESSEKRPGAPPSAFYPLSSEEALISPPLPSGFIP